MRSRQSHPTGGDRVASTTQGAWQPPFRLLEVRASLGCTSTRPRQEASREHHRSDPDHRHALVCRVVGDLAAASPRGARGALDRRAAAGRRVARARRRRLAARAVAAPRRRRGRCGGASALASGPVASLAPRRRAGRARRRARARQRRAPDRDRADHAGADRAASRRQRDLPLDGRRPRRDVHRRPLGSPSGRRAGVVPDRRPRRTGGSLLRGAGPSAGLDHRAAVVHVRVVRQDRHACDQRRPGQPRAADVARPALLAGPVDPPGAVHGALRRPRQPWVRRRRAQRAVRVVGLGARGRQGRRSGDPPRRDGAAAASGARAADRDPRGRQQVRARPARPRLEPRLTARRPPRPGARRDRRPLAGRRDRRAGDGRRPAVQGRRQPRRQALRRRAGRTARPAVPLDPVRRHADLRVHRHAGQVPREPARPRQRW